MDAASAARTQSLRGGSWCGSRFWSAGRRVGSFASSAGPPRARRIAASAVQDGFEGPDDPSQGAAEKRGEQSAASRSAEGAAAGGRSRASGAERESKRPGWGLATLATREELRRWRERALERPAVEEDVEGPVCSASCRVESAAEEGQGAAAAATSGSAHASGAGAPAAQASGAGSFAAQASGAGAPTAQASGARAPPAQARGARAPPFQARGARAPASPGGRPGQSSPRSE